MTSPTSERGFLIRGRVQGVGFRWWTRTLAQEVGVRGTVRNRSDGTVEVHARGPAEALERFGARLRQGPPSAEVEDVRPLEASIASNIDDFRIIH